MDIKPANFVFFPGPRVKLIDLGVAMKLPEAGFIESSQPFIGTLEYLAPEALGVETDGRLAATASTATDVWAFGCTIHSLVTVGNKPPFPCKDVRNVRAQRVAISGYFEPAAILPMCADMAGDITSLVKGCLHTTPQERPTAEELLRNPLFRDSNQQRERTCKQATKHAGK